MKRETVAKKKIFTEESDIQNSPPTTNQNIFDIPVDVQASGNAPFIYFDMATTFGVNVGDAHITLEAVRYITTGQNMVVPNRVVVGNLRFGMEALRSLKEAVDNLVLIATTPGSQTRN